MNVRKMLKSCKYNQRLKTMGGTFSSSLSGNKYSSKLSNTGKYSDQWEQLRKQRLELDNYTCQKCGFDGHDCPNKLQVHHKVPLARGGRNKLSNLITLCIKCHKKQHYKTLIKGRKHV